MKRTRELAAKLEQPADLWDLETFLTQRRKEIDRDFDYRYSVLPGVLARLILKGRLRQEELQGLGEEKLRLIERYVSFASRDEE